MLAMQKYILCSTTLTSALLKQKCSLLTNLVRINQQLHGMTNHPPTITNQPPVVSSGEKQDYSSIPNVLRLKSNLFCNGDQK